MVKGRTRTVTEIEDAPPAALIVVSIEAQCFVVILGVIEPALQKECFPLRASY